MLVTDLTKKTILVGLPLTLAALLAGSLLVLYAKTKATEKTLSTNKEYSGFGYPDDRHARRPHPYVSLSHPAALVVDTARPVRIVKIGPDHYFVDFGRAAFGALRFSTLAGKGKAVLIHVKLGERMAPGPHVWQHSLESGLRGTGIAFYERAVTAYPGKTNVIEGPPRPRPTARDLPDGLTTVFPFRYAEIAGGHLDTVSLARLAVHYPFHDDMADFHSSDNILNKVWKFCAYSVKATSYAGIYVDGNRERTPYEADAYIDQLSDYTLSDDYRLGRHTLEYLLHNPTWPTEWAMFPVLMAYNDFMYSGDRDYLRRIYPALKILVLTPLARADGLISSRGPKALSLAKRIGMASTMSDVVDWPPSERDDYTVEPVSKTKFIRFTVQYGLDRALSSASTLFGFRRARIYYSQAAKNALDQRYRLIGVNTVVNAFYYATLTRMAFMAASLGYSQEATSYAATAERVRTAMLQKLFDHKAGHFVDGEGSRHASLHANMFPLAFGIVPAQNLKSVTTFVRSKGMAASVYGAQFLLTALYRAGAAKAALALLTSETKRSWIAMMRDTGSTITTEAWNDHIKPNEDWNHAWGTSPVNIIARWMMGIQPIEPGFTRFAIRPQPGTLTHAEMRVPTVRGEIGVSFTFKDRRFHLRAHIPHATNAEIYVPARLGNTVFTRILVNGKPLPVHAEASFLYAGTFGAGNADVLAVSAGKASQ
jgi:hypothetical protein